MTGDLDQISRAIGGLEGEVRGIRELLITQHEFADKKIDRIEAEIRNDKHATRQVEQKVELLGSAQFRTAEKVDEVNEKISGEGGIEQRLSSLEKLVERALAYAAAIVAIGSIIGYVITHYSGQVFKLLMGRP